MDIATVTDADPAVDIPSSAGRWRIDREVALHRELLRLMAQQCRFVSTTAASDMMPFDERVLDVLRVALSGDRHSATRRLRAWIAQQQASLSVDALDTGDEVFREKPRCFVHRLLRV